MGDLLYGPDSAEPAAPVMAAAGQDGAGDRFGAWGPGRRVAVPVLSRPAAGTIGRLARRRGAAARCDDGRRADEPVASAAAGRRRGLSGHACVLALGTARSDRPSVARACLLLARDLPVQHAVRRPVRPGGRSAGGVAADLPPACP